MRILFDQGTPLPIWKFLGAHDVSTAALHRWNTLKNGNLLTEAELAGFKVLLATDKNFAHQQNLARR